MHGFIRADLLNDHMPYCQPHGPQKIKMPADKDKFLRFTNVHKQLSSPFVIYADSECLLLSQCVMEFNKLTNTVLN